MLYQRNIRIALAPNYTMKFNDWADQSRAQILHQAEVNLKADDLTPYTRAVQHLYVVNVLAATHKKIHQTNRHRIWDLWCNVRASTSTYWPTNLAESHAQGIGGGILERRKK